MDKNVSQISFFHNILQTVVRLFKISYQKISFLETLETLSRAKRKIEVHKKHLKVPEK